MSWATLARGLFASRPSEVEGPARVVAGLKEIVALMREPQGEPCIIVTNVAGGSAVSTIIRRAKAIVSTIGGPNSHIVVVARDYHVPCIVGATDLDLSRLAVGARLRMREDGSVEIWCDGRDGNAAPTTEQMRLLRNLAFAGAVGDAREIVGFAGEVPAALAALAAAGLVETEGLIAPSAKGLETLEAWYAQDRARLDAARRGLLHAEFRPLDVRVKGLARAWQEADARDDWDGRMKAIEALGALHADTLAFIDRHAQNLPRFPEYRERLTRALERILDGETEYFVKVQIDSYHTIWFQMHEDLLRILERARDPE